MRKTSWWALAGLAVLAGTASAQSIHVPVTIDTLPNGLRLIVNEDHSSPIVTVNSWFDVGSANEQHGRTGLAHLFEHLMFMGSQHAPYPQFDRLLEAAGADNNASTDKDVTDYFEAGPVNALPLMLWLDADRMGWFLPVMDAQKVDAQRDIVKNERRQTYENQPYGLVADVEPPLMYETGHPYSWPVIGSMADLSAASLDDVRDFFRHYYAPNNVTIAVVGDVRRDSVLQLVKKYFSDIPRGPAITHPAPAPGKHFTADTMVVLEDRVQAPRLYYEFAGVRVWSPDDAALEMTASILSGSKNSRLQESMVYGDQIATAVLAHNGDNQLAGVFKIVATPRPDHTIPELQRAIDRELKRLADQGPTERELLQARNTIEAVMLSAVETIQGKANFLNQFYAETGDPDSFQRYIDRMRAVTAADVQRVVRQYLLGARAIITVVPTGKKNLAAVPRSATP